ncbi:hypothetical protein JCM9152_187 [Halalkalibacter hemicellulosilyticusJCM 9152]|uniref:Uncharacterized protein n=1 Tax=Halalkalibacter hemicellulosilyticusJCM 9152 TaxID=1236971 RepID=W4QA14_9BACI|nr:hypothetical protein JCM9152_187 [Halalkalibacter hemicellulosilyticusJCM 9152]
MGYLKLKLIGLSKALVLLQKRIRAFCFNGARVEYNLKGLHFRYVQCVKKDI